MDFRLLFSFLLEAGNIVIFESTENQRRYFSALRYPKQHCFMKASMLPPLCPSRKCSTKMELSIELSGMILTGENRSDRRKSCPIAPSSSTWSGQGSNWPSEAKGWWQTTWTKGYKKVKVLLSNAPLFPKKHWFWKVSVLSPCKCTVQECGGLVDWQ